MKREAVQDFLNLPGIVGVALVDGRSRPYFCGVDQALNFQQKEALAQGIQQVVETTPAEFEFFEFQFSGHQVYIYRLEHGIILLVLTNGNLVYSDYIQVVEKLKSGLQEDITNAIATFRLLAGSMTLSKQNYWKSQATSSTSASTSLDPSGSSTLTSGVIPHKVSSSQTASRPSPAQPELRALVPNARLDLSPPLPSSRSIEQGTASTAPTLSPPPEPPSQSHPDLKELLTVLNAFSKEATQYLGATMVANYWKSSRPAVEWLTNFQVDRSAQITFIGTPSAGPSQTINPEQHQWLREWVAAFIERCSKVIRDFPNLVNKMKLNDHQRSLLLPDQP